MRCLFRFRYVVFSALLAGALSCDWPTASSGGGGASLAITPEAVSLLPLETAQLEAALRRSDGTSAAATDVSWESLSPSIASVDQTGRVVAQSHGGPAARYTSVVGTMGGTADTVPVEVRPWPVRRIVAALDSIVVSPGDSAALDAVPASESGVALTGRDILWLSSNPSVVTITGGRWVKALPYDGVTDIRTSVVVYSEGVADTVVVIVAALRPTAIVVDPDSVELRPGQESLVTATVRAGDVELQGAAIEWTSSDTSVLAVGGGGELLARFYTGPDTRVVQAVATAAGVSGAATVVVRPLVVASVSVFPASETLVPNRTSQLTTVMRDGTGLFLEGHPAVWTSSDTVVATVSADGLLLTRQAGVATITARNGDAVGTMTVTVVHPAVSISVPSLTTVWIGRPQPITAVLRDSVGAVLSGRLVTWRSSDMSRATVSAAGVVTALSEGLVTITATAEGLSAPVSVDLFPEPTAAITITFDDGWRSVLQLAAPELTARRLRANVGWLTNVDWADVMTPDELRVLQASGWSILSHTMTHPYLTTLPPDSVAVELQSSRNRIVDLGFDPRVLIIPYFDRNNDVLAASAAAGYTYTRCCAQDAWSPDTLVAWPIRPEGRHRLAGVDVTNYDGPPTTYNFRSPAGRAALRDLLSQAVAGRKFVDVIFHNIFPEDTPDLRLTLDILAEFRRYLITYGMLADVSG